MPFYQPFPNAYFIPATGVQFGFSASGYSGADPTRLINLGALLDVDRPNAIDIDGYDDGFRIDNHGSVVGGTALWAYASKVEFNNYGDVTGDFYLLSSPLRFDNYGSFNGRIKISEDSYGTRLGLINYGHMSNPDGAYIMSGSDSLRDWVSNYGVIEGDIHTNGGHDSISAIEGTIDGNIYFGRGQDLYQGSQGEVTGTIYGGAGDDQMRGGRADDRIMGGAGSDRIDGNEGNDRLNGGAHYDEIEGGAGRDTFVFYKGDDMEFIKDFENNIDTLELDESIWGGGLTPAQVLERFATSENGNTELRFGDGDRILLAGVEDYQLLANDIVLV